MTPIIISVETASSTEYFFSPDFADFLNTSFLASSTILCLILGVLSASFLLNIFKK